MLKEACEYLLSTGLHLEKFNLNHESLSNVLNAFNSKTHLMMAFLYANTRWVSLRCASYGVMWLTGVVQSSLPSIKVVLSSSRTFRVGWSRPPALTPPLALILGLWTVVVGADFLGFNFSGKLAPNTATSYVKTVTIDHDFVIVFTF